MPNGIRGKYAARVRQRTNVVLLQPDVANAFPTEKAVNEALRGILAITRIIETESKANTNPARRKILNRKSHP